jgi:hypothetical protein
MLVIIFQSWFFFIHQKGFGDEEPTLQLRLEEFFAKYGKTQAVRMRRGENKEFKVRHTHDPFAFDITFDSRALFSLNSPTSIPSTPS